MKQKTSKKDFEIFKNEVHRLMDKWELNNWDVRFEHKPLGSCEANMYRDGGNYNVTFGLNAESEYGTFKEEERRRDYIKKLAKHEVLHLLLGRLTYCGEARWCTDSEMEEAEEELVRKLIKIT